MKKCMSLILALVMVCSFSVCAFAYSTEVVYVGQGTEEYEVTVPSTLAPGDSGEVKVEGTWSSDMTVEVTAPNEVTLTNSIDGSTMALEVNFKGISQVGDNTDSLSVSETISVSDISNALFGTWSGVITYTVTTKDNSSDTGEEEPELPEGFYEDSNGVVRNVGWSGNSTHDPQTHACPTCGATIHDSHGELDTSGYDTALAEAVALAEELGGEVVNTTDTSDGTLTGNDGSANCEGGHGRCSGHPWGPDEDGESGVNYDSGANCSSGQPCGSAHAWSIYIVLN